MFCRVSEALLNLLATSTSDRTHIGDPDRDLMLKGKREGEDGGKMAGGSEDEGRASGEGVLQQEELIQHSCDDLRVLEFEYVVDNAGKRGPPPPPPPASYSETLKCLPFRMSKVAGSGGDCIPQWQRTAAPYHDVEVLGAQGHLQTPHSACASQHH